MRAYVCNDQYNAWTRAHSRTSMRTPHQHTCARVCTREFVFHTTHARTFRWFCRVTTARVWMAHAIHWSARDIKQILMPSVMLLLHHRGPMVAGIPPREASDRLSIFQARFDELWRKYETYSGRFIPFYSSVLGDQAFDRKWLVLTLIQTVLVQSQLQPCLNSTQR